MAAPRTHMTVVHSTSARATLRYTWPVWVFLDGIAQVCTGNVFGTHFDGFDMKLARLSANLGVRSNGNRDSGFEATFGVGSEPFGDTFRINSYRIVLGSHHGF